MNPAVVLGIPLHPVTAAQALDRIDAFVAAREPRQVVTVNVDFAALAHRDVELHRILCEADLALCDGMPLVWAGGWLGAPLPERVAASDLLPALLERAALRGHRVFMLGTSAEVLDEACRRCAAAWPGLRLCGTYSPLYGRLLAMDRAEMGRLVRAAAPDILLVGLGAPKQEKLIAMLAREWGVPCSIGVGACIDFLAGRFPRAPAWMRRVGLEWAFRLLNEPRRLFRRYVGDFLFYFPTLVAELLRGRASPRTRPRPRPPPGAAERSSTSTASRGSRPPGWERCSRRATRGANGDATWCCCAPPRPCSGCCVRRASRASCARPPRRRRPTRSWRRIWPRRRWPSCPPRAATAGPCAWSCAGS